MILNTSQLEQAQAQIHRDGREHAINSGALLTERRINEVARKVAQHVQSDGTAWQQAQIASIVDSYTEGYSLGLDEHEALFSDTE